MKIPKFLRAMEHIDEDLILEVAEEEKAPPRPSRKKQWVTFGAVAATFALLLTGIFALPMLIESDSPLPPSGTTPDSGILQLVPGQSLPTQTDVGGTGRPSLPVGTLNATIALDVNPSLEIEIDEEGQVIRICAINEDAEIIIHDLAEYGTDLGAAMDAIMDAMVANGFLSAEKNDILLSVDTGDTALSTSLRETLSAHIKEHLNASNIEASILTQSYDKSQEPPTAETGVSQSKSSLCRAIFDAGLSGMTWSELAELTIEELNAIVEEAPHLLVDGYSMWRRQDPSTLHGLMFPQDALDIALAYSHLTEEDVSSIHIELERHEINRDGFFIVTFEAAGMVYRHEIFCRHNHLDTDGITGTSGVAYASVCPVGSEPGENEVSLQERYLSLEEVRTYPFALGLADKSVYYGVIQEDFFGILGGEPVFYIRVANYNDRGDTHTYLFNAITGEYRPEPTESRFVSWKDYLAETRPNARP